MPTAARPHRLELYEHAVQQPGATAALLGRAYLHHRLPHDPLDQEAWLLREDFAGGAAVAEAWCMSHPERQALAVERHAPTFRWARRRRGGLDDLHLVLADVADFDRPRVDLVAALNFSTFGYHTPDTLLAYFRHARRCLRPGGVLVLDAFGGPGAQRLGTQDRPADGFTYHWEQRHFDPLTHRLDARIHFSFPGHGRFESAFRYDWRLWTLPELFELLRRARFGPPSVWAPGPRAPHGPDRPVSRLSHAENWVVTLAARR
ncbi:MAG: class I SAM-dependent methyltransferase [Planctomycetota bacterium]